MELSISFDPDSLREYIYESEEKAGASWAMMHWFINHATDSELRGIAAEVYESPELWEVIDRLLVKTATRVHNKHMKEQTALQEDIDRTEDYFFRMENN